ncbi:MAG: SAM-dependent methyltransferase [Bacteroidota bacterium]
MEKQTDNNLRTLLEEELASEITLVASDQKSKETLIQDFTSISESIIWNLQRQYFEEASIEAWRKGVVPHYITSSSYMACSYAQMAMAWLQDQLEEGYDHLRILELGAGSGQFSFHFLRHLEQQWQQNYPNDILPITYVMSDVTRANIKFWQSHQALRPWFDTGLLDGAFFDVEKDADLTLENSGVTWSASEEKAPMLVLANYLFDSIRQDYWQIENNLAQEVLVASYCPSEVAEKPALHTLNYQYSLVKPAEKSYSDQSLNELLQFYCQKLKNGVVSIPTYGKSCIDTLKAWCNSQLTLIAGDKGQSDWQQFENIDYPVFIHHGSISTSVNFHALRWLAHQEGGHSWICGQPTDDFKVCAISWQDEDRLPHFARKCFDFAKNFSPADQFVLKKIIERNYQHLNVAEIASYLRFSHYDPKALKRAIPQLMKLAPQLSAPQVSLMQQFVTRTWDNYYWLGEKEDLAFMIGCFFYEANDYQSALVFFNHSVALYGPDSGTICNIENCQKMLETLF